MRKLFPVLAAMAAIVIMSASFLVSSPSVAHADEDETQQVEEALTQDQLKRFERMPDEDKRKLLDEVIAGIAKDKCGDFNYFRKMESFLSFQKRGCEEQTRDALNLMYPDPTAFVTGQEPPMDFCEALQESKASGDGITGCLREKVNKQLWSWTGTQIRGFLEQSELGRAVLNVTDAIDNSIKFIADPKSSLEEVANSSKSESIALTAKVLEEISSTTEFDASSQEFKTRWALYAGLGVVGLGLMIMFLFKQHSNGEMSDDDFSKSLLYYLPASLFLVIYGPWLMNELQQRVAPLTDGTTDWAADMISDFILIVSRFGSLESTSWFGPLAAIIFFGLLFIGAIALLVYFLLIPIFQQLMGLAIVLLIGMLLSPKTRRYVLKVASALGTMVLLKPAAFLVLGAVFGVLSSQPAFEGGVDDVLVNVGNLGATAAIMLMIVLSPAALFRWMPVMESREAKFGGISPEISAGVGGAVGGAIGAGAGSVRRAISNRRNNAGPSPKTSGTPTNGGAGENGGAGAGSGGMGGSPSAHRQHGTDSTDGTESQTPTGSRTSGAEGRSSQNPSGMTPAGPSPHTPASSSAQSEDSGSPQSQGPGQEPNVGAPRGSESGTARASSDTHASPTSSSQAGSLDATGPGTEAQASQERTNSPTPRGKSGAGLIATAALAPLTAGAVGLLAGTKYAATNAAAQARMAAHDADPDSWDSFKDR